MGDGDVAQVKRTQTKSPKPARRDYQLVSPRSRADFRRWLKMNHKQTESVWVQIFKKGSGRENLSVADVVEEALCFGWIDSVPNKIDELSYKLLVSPRKPKSVWSAINKKRVEALVAAKKMQPPGLVAVERAKQNGSWSSLDASDRLEISEDLQNLFRRNKKAEANFQAFAPSSKRAILEWIYMAKQPETRLRRCQEAVRMAALGLRANNYQDQRRLILQKRKKGASK